MGTQCAHHASPEAGQHLDEGTAAVQTGRTRPDRWQVIAHSVTGAGHARLEQENQDAYDFLPPRGKGIGLSLAVADGHGSERSPRSRRGAELAVKAALAELEVLRHHRRLSSQAAVKHYAEEQLPKRLEARWKTLVEADWQQTAVLGSRDEVQRAASEHGGRDLFRLYGTTILGAVVTDSYLVYLQLGDGDIVEVSEDGNARRPFGRDARLLGNETTSLCQDRTWCECRVLFQGLAGRPPALILLASDGLSNSYRDDEGFLQVGRDVLHALRAGGAETVKAALGKTLAHITLHGSGDDITVGLLWRLEAQQRGAHRARIASTAIQAVDEGDGV